MVVVFHTAIVEKIDKNVFEKYSLLIRVNRLIKSVFKNYVYYDDDQANGAFF
jgi:hypothetical protein